MIRKEKSLFSETRYSLHRDELANKCKSLELNGKYDVAQQVMHEIYKKTQEEKDEELEELRIKQENARIDQESNHLNEFQEFNAMWEKRFEEHRLDAEEKINEMIELNKNDRTKCEDELREKIPKNPKFSSELLNMMQIKKGLLKFKEYGEAHKVQNRINSLTKEEISNWDIERENNIAQKLSYLDSKHDARLSALKKKLSTAEDEKKKKRTIDMEHLLQKFQNEKKELQNFQIQEMNKKLAQGVNKN